MIPAGQLNAVAMKYLNYFPAPNRTPINNVINNYQNQQVSTTTDNEFDARLDGGSGTATTSSFAARPITTTRS